MFSGIWRKAKKKNMKKERKFGLKEFPRPLTKEEWRNQNSGDSDSRGQNCPDGGEAVL